MTNNTIYEKFISTAAIILLVLTSILVLTAEDLGDEATARWMRLALAVAYILAAMRVRVTGRKWQFWLFTVAGLMLLATVVLFR